MKFQLFYRRIYRILKIFLCNISSLYSSKKGISKSNSNSSNYIVSLTTYGKRIKKVHLAIESIMQGDWKPDKIILWISEDLKNSTLPKALMNQCKRGLEIKFREDIRSYTKLFYALREYPTSTIITIDDDCIYNKSFLKNLIKSSIDDPASIFANRIHKITRNADNTLKSYLKWDWYQKNNTQTSTLNFLTGVGGVLYPPNSLHSEVFNRAVFLSICPTADDVWFYAMAKLNKTQIKKAYTNDIKGQDYIISFKELDDCLSTSNTDPENSANDTQIKAVFKKYNIYDILTNG